MKKVFTDNRNLIRAAIFVIPAILLVAWILANVMIQRSMIPQGTRIYPPSDGLGNVFYIQPVGEVDNTTLEFIQNLISSTWKRDTQILKSFPPPYLEGNRRNQLKADYLREYMTRKRGIPKDTFRLVIVTESDLYADGYNFIFGQAELGGMVAVISTHRLKPMMDGGVSVDGKKGEYRDIYYERMIKLLTHELGHTFGLTHCKDPSCVMYFHPSLVELDAGGAQFCDLCAERLLNRHRPQPQ